MIQHEIFRVESRIPHYISCYIAESRFPLGQCRPLFFLAVYICQLHIWTLYLLKFGWCRVEQSCFRFIMQVAKLFSNKPLILTGHFHALTKTIKEPLSYKMWPIKKCTYPISPPFELHSLPSNGCNSTLI